MRKSKINSYGRRRKVHLHNSPRTSKKRGRINYYSLATCYYDEGKNQKKIFYTIGELTQQEVENYKLFLSVLNGDIARSNLVDIEQLVYEEDKSYLDVLALDLLWKKFDLHEIFDASLGNNRKLSTEHVARILTLNKMLEPTSKIRTITWFKSTLLAKIIGIEEKDYDKNKCFRELENIHKHKTKLEKHFLRFSKKNGAKYEAYYFDGTTSWFEGSRCNLAKCDKEKTRGIFDKVIGLMLITDNQGYPVAWEVVDGNTKDTSAFEGFIRRISADYGFEEITYCFDRGVASIKNFDLVKKFRGKFISGINDNQIKKIFDLKKFRLTRVRIADKIEEREHNEHGAKRLKRRIIDIDGFLSFNTNTFYKDLGVIKDKRYIASFKYDLFLKESLDRERRIKDALLAVNNKNEELSQAKKERDFNATERELIDILKKHRVKEFLRYTLKPTITSHSASSFEIELDYKKEKVEEAQLSDGLLIYITDHIEKNENGTFCLNARDIISHYRGKYVVENAFRELKSFLDIRPIHVWTEAHVKAHFDIGIVAYFLNNYIYRQLCESGISLRDFYEQLDEYAKASKLVAPSGIELFKLKPVAKSLKECFKTLKIPQTSSRQLHKAHSISQ
jgi:transposase